MSLDTWRHRGWKTQVLASRKALPKIQLQCFHQAILLYQGSWLRTNLLSLENLRRRRQIVSACASAQLRFW